MDIDLQNIKMECLSDEAKQFIKANISDEAKQFIKENIGFFSPKSSSKIAEEIGVEAEEEVSENSRNTIEWHPLYGNTYVVDFLRKIANEGRDKNYISKNPLYLPPELTPPIGMTYSWGTYSIRGEMHHTNIARLERTGHKPVPIERHPELFSDNSIPGTISREGSVLVESPSQAAWDAIREEREERESKFFNRLMRKIRGFFKIFNIAKGSMYE